MYSSIKVYKQSLVQTKIQIILLLVVFLGAFNNLRRYVLERGYFYGYAKPLLFRGLPSSIEGFTWESVFAFVERGLFPEVV